MLFVEINELYAVAVYFNKYIYLARANSEQDDRWPSVFGSGSDTVDRKLIDYLFDLRVCSTAQRRFLDTDVTM